MLLAGLFKVLFSGPFGFRESLIVDGVINEPRHAETRQEEEREVARGLGFLF